MKKRLLSLLFIICFIIISAPSFAADKVKITLPDIEGWNNGPDRVTHIDTVSGYKGSWQERDYRTPDGTPFHAVWIDGAGEKQWNIEIIEGTANDGPMGSNSQYKTISILGYTASIETHPVLGISLTVKIKGKGTLTLESQIADEGEIIRAAEVITGRIKNK